VALQAVLGAFAALYQLVAAGGHSGFF